MPGKVGQEESLGGGVAALQAIQAVVDIAAQPEGEDGPYYDFFASLATITTAQSSVAQRGFTLGLSGLLFALVTDLHGPAVLPGVPSLTVDGPSRSLTQVVTTLDDILAGQDPDVVKIARVAHQAARLADLIRAIDNSSAEEPVTALTLAQANVLVLRRIIKERAGRHPAARWALLGQVMASVMGPHYMQIYSEMV